MKQYGLVALGVLAAASLATSVLAGECQTNKVDKAGQHMERFTKADTNGDGKLSLDEFKAAFPKGDSEKRFAKIDANSDGFITPEEFKASHGKKHDKPVDQPAK